MRYEFCPLPTVAPLRFHETYEPCPDGVMGNVALRFPQETDPATKLYDVLFDTYPVPTLVRKPASLFKVDVLPLNEVAYGTLREVVNVADDTENPVGTDVR